MVHGIEDIKERFVVYNWHFHRYMFLTNCFQHVRRNLYLVGYLIVYLVRRNLYKLFWEVERDLYREVTVRGEKSLPMEAREKLIFLKTSLTPLRGGYREFWIPPLYVFFFWPLKAIVVH